MLFRSDLFAHGRSLLDPCLLLGVARGIEDKAAQQLHAVVAAGHREAFVARARNQHREGAWIVCPLDGQLALRLSGDVEKALVLDELAGDLHGRQALGAVAGAAKDTTIVGSSGRRKSRGALTMSVVAIGLKSYRLVSPA